MSKSDKKLVQIKLQHEIAEILRKDNGVSCHFDFHVNMLSGGQTIKLNLLTYNVKHNEYMLLRTTLGPNSIQCLESMLVFIKSNDQQKQEYSYTITWSRAGEKEEYVSYFWGTSEEEVMAKFLHEKKASNFTYSVQQNPLA
ncbi:MAG: hypothetical protein ACI8ZN_000720 [Bacteroidia bacterium]|jgi:hypothetical protein